VFEADRNQMEEWIELNSYQATASWEDLSINLIYPLDWVCFDLEGPGFIVLAFILISSFILYMREEKM